MSMPKEIFVIKGNGDREKFSEEKVLRSMKRVGVPQNVQYEALKHIKEELYQDIPTSEVFSHIKEFLEKKNEHIPSLKLNLKKAIFELGPTGFPFEHYIAKIFESKGYSTSVGTTLEGDCVTHEIDVLLEKNGKKEIVEAKFHNQQGTRTDIQTALYTYARFLDVEQRNDIQAVWIVTNTKLTKQVVDYTKCKGIAAIAWNYPKNGHLQEEVEEPSLYPITILSTLPSHTISRMVDNGLVLAKDILETKKEMLEDKYLLNPKQVEQARDEARKLCGVVGSIEK